MDLQKKLFLSIGIPIITIIMLLVFLFIRSKSSIDSRNENGGEETYNEQSANYTDPVQDELDITTLNGDAGERNDLEKVPSPKNLEEQEALYLKQLSRLFAERLFSYSNQSGNVNINDASVFATSKMKKYLETLKVEQSSFYEGVTTKLFQSELVDKTESEATVHISVVQEKSTKDSTEKSQKSGKILFIKDSSGNWLVDGLFWD